MASIIIDTKPWYASKTIWANVIAVVATVGAGYGLDIPTEAQAEIVAGVMAVINIALRLVTSKGVTVG